MSSFLRRAGPSNGGTAGGGGCAPDADDARDFPALLEFLGSTTWPDGSPRVTGTLILMVEEGRPKMCLSDRDQALVLFATVPSLSLALVSAEDHLRDPGADWRASKTRAGRPSGKK